MPTGGPINPADGWMWNPAITRRQRHTWSNDRAMVALVLDTDLQLIDPEAYIRAVNLRAQELIGQPLAVRDPDHDF